MQNDPVKKSTQFLPKILGMLLLCATGYGHAGLTVVADHGGKAAAPFYDAINNAPNEWETKERSATPSVPPVASPAMVLPVRTPEMTPGTIDHRPLHLPGIGALYLVGDDPLSRAWLTENAAQLKSMNAVGMVVNVESEGALQELQALTQGGILSPAAASDLANRLQLNHYPVLITEHELTQQVN